MIQGDSDFIVPHTYNSEVMVKALQENNIKYKYRLCKKLNHGCGLGIGTDAEGWVEEAVAFWQSQFAV